MPVRYGKIKRMSSGKEADVTEIGGSQKARHISPRGLCSKSAEIIEGRKNDAIIIPLLAGDTQDIILAIQDEKELPLKDGDVGLTDGKSSIHLQYKNGNIVIKGGDISIEAMGKLTLSGENIEMKTGMTGMVKHDGTNIGNTHKHSHYHQHQGTYGPTVEVIGPLHTNGPS